MMVSFRSVAAIAALLLGGSAWDAPAAGQQFNSDNYLSKPAGVVTMIATLGQRNEIFMLTFSLLPRWEFTTAAYIINEDDDPNTDDGYSTTLYAKYMLLENAAKTGGVAFKFGTGLDPGYLTEVGVEDAFRSFWVNMPMTFPFLQNRLSVDFMPGVTFSREYGNGRRSRLWVHVFGARSVVSRKPQVGVRRRDIRRRGRADLDSGIQDRPSLGAGSIHDVRADVRSGVQWA